LIAALPRAVVNVRAWTSAAARGSSTTTRVREPRGQRSRGFIVDRNGYILTNDATVRGASAIEVRLHDGRRLPAVLVAQDTRNDVAVLKINATGLPAIALGDSKALAAGQPVLVIGDGHGPNRMTTGALIHATRATGGNLAIDLPQATWGPLLNQFGQAVGIVTGIATLPGVTPTLTLAVPIDRVKPILRPLLAPSAPLAALGSDR
jgi:serine protease Do